MCELVDWGVGEGRGEEQPSGHLIEAGDIATGRPPEENQSSGLRIVRQIVQ